jgi:hypothetical protein
MPFKAVIPARVVYHRYVQAVLRSDENRGNNLGDDMAGRNQIDVVAATFLERQHDQGNLVWRCTSTRSGLTNLPVLTKDAVQITPPEENGAGAHPSADGLLLTVVSTETVNQCLFACLADRSFRGLQPVDATIPRAKVTLLQTLTRQLNSVFENTGA